MQLFRHINYIFLNKYISDRIISFIIYVLWILTKGSKKEFPNFRIWKHFLNSAFCLLVNSDSWKNNWSVFAKDVMDAFRLRDQIGFHNSVFDNNFQYKKINDLHSVPLPYLAPALHFYHKFDISDLKSKP